jgi:hypothetical protein
MAFLAILFALAIRSGEINAGDRPGFHPPRDFAVALAQIHRLFTPTCDTIAAGISGNITENILSGQSGIAR